ncbi:hypothetical protein BDR04DRAFT_1232917 [Suillus decipiens]|nr:hypothetical protein BDR04DRAFT_1232917 [Suillus decipiens]
MQYSSDEITAARSLQFSTYMYVSMATFWTYDYACSLREEWTYLLRSDGGKVKCLYIIARYLPFVLLTTNLYMSFNPNENPDRCRVLANVDSGIGMVSVVFAEYFFMLRTYALWNNNKFLLTVMVTTFVAFIIASFTIAFTNTVPAAYATSAIPGITGCYQSTTSLQLFIPFVLLTVFELALMILTLVRAIQSWQMSSSHLYVSLVNHNISYYACGLLFSVTNIFTSLLLQYSYRTMLHDFQFIILAILATRMHLHLWEMSRQARGSVALMGIPLTDRSSMNFATMT